MKKFLSIIVAIALVAFAAPAFAVDGVLSWDAATDVDGKALQGSVTYELWGAVNDAVLTLKLAGITATTITRPGLSPGKACWQVRVVFIPNVPNPKTLMSPFSNLWCADVPTPPPPVQTPKQPVLTGTLK